jgi:glycosyltransferase 2 family protein
MRNNKIVNALQYIIFLGGGIGLVWWQLGNMSVAQKQAFVTAIKNTNYWLILPVILMNLGSHLVRCMRWKMLLEPLQYKPSLKNLFAATMVGYLANSFVPRLGEVVKCTLLAKYEKLKVDNLVGTIILERTFDLVCYAIFIGITVLIQVDVISGLVKQKLSKLNMEGSTFLKLGLIIGIVVMVVFVFKYLLKKYPNSTIFFKIKLFATGIINGVTSIKIMKNRKLFVFYTVIIWSLYLLQIYVAFKAMEGTAHLGIKAACSVLSLSTLAMIVTPGGIGSFPIFVMETLIVYGVASALGMALGWVIWGVSTILIIVVGLLAFAALPYINKKLLNENAILHTK